MKHPPGQKWNKILVGPAAYSLSPAVKLIFLISSVAPLLFFFENSPDLISGIIALQPLFVCCIPNCLNYYKMGLESNKDIYLFILRNCICNDDTNLTNNG